jgi:hypothetical protein
MCWSWLGAGEAGTLSSCRVWLWTLGELLDVESLVRHLVPARSVFAFLADHCRDLFAEGRRSAGGLRSGVAICAVLTGRGVTIAPAPNTPPKSRSQSACARRDARLLTEVVRVQTDKEIGRGLNGARR